MKLVGPMLFLVLSLSATCNADNPGIRVRMTQDVFEEGVKYTVNSMTEEMSTYNLPDVKGSATIDSDEMTYALTNIKVKDLYFANISSKFVPKTGVQMSLKRGSAVINCQCDLKSWLINDNAAAEIRLSGTSIFMLLGARRIEPGVPSVFMLDCQSTIEKIDFKMESGISYVYDALQPEIDGVLRSTITQQLCSALRKQVLDWDESFNNLNMNITLSQDVIADLSLTSDPEISTKYADLNLKGQFRVPNVTMMNYSPAPFTLPADASSRSCAGISEASLNSLVDAYYSSGGLNAMLSKASESVKLTTSDLTAALPEISKQYQSPTPAKITLNATSCPKVNLKVKNITMNFQGLFQIDVKPAEGKSQRVLEANIVAVLSGDISLTDAKQLKGLNLSASISVHRFQIDKTKTSSKEAKDAASEKCIETIFSQMLLPNINEKLRQGMFIASRILKNLSSTSKQGYELVGMDFSW